MDFSLLVRKPPGQGSLIHSLPLFPVRCNEQIHQCLSQFEYVTAFRRGREHRDQVQRHIAAVRDLLKRLERLGCRLPVQIIDTYCIDSPILSASSLRLRLCEAHRIRSARA